MTAEYERPEAIRVLRTGQLRCYDTDGRETACPGSGQEGEFSGAAWPEPRFTGVNRDLVRDAATGLVWPRDAGLFTFPLSWTEGLEAVLQMNREGRFGRTDWRLPNRRELRSLISHGAKKPALPHEHPFDNVFLGWYWTSTSFAGDRAYAWTVHLEGGRMFYGSKDQESLVWPVCGDSRILPATGQVRCYDAQGREIACPGTGQDGDLVRGAAWPEPRFVPEGTGVRDTLTGLVWHAGIAGTRLGWEEALAAVRELARHSGPAWRLPTINELESLVDASRHSPALPAGFPFPADEEGYWSSTTSFFEPSWAYVLYMQKGAVGVGFKRNREFGLLPVH